MSYLSENLCEIEQRITFSCETAGRKRDDVLLIAVSKTKPISLLEEAYACGIRDFGENRVQELTQKAESMPDDIRWHMIGHLQKNKVKAAVRHAYMIHSVDSLVLAETISAEAVKQSKSINILLEVNIAGEESKFGYSPSEVLTDISAIAALPNLKIKGLMTIAPFTEIAESNRDYFRQLKELAVDITNKNIDNVDMEVLSMGMSGDFQVAIEEGATMIRVGTSVFGER